MDRSHLAESRNMADVPLKRCDGVNLPKNTQNTFGSGQRLPWQHDRTPTEAAVSEFPAPSC